MKQELSEISLELVNSSNLEDFNQRLNDHPELIDEESASIMCHLINEGKTDFFENLLTKKLDPNMQIGEHKDSLLTYLAKNPKIEKKLDFIKILLSQPKIDVNFASDDSFEFKTALSSAITFDDGPLFQELIKHEKFEAKQGSSLLHAVKNGRPLYAAALLEKYAPIHDLQNLLFHISEKAEFVDNSGFLESSNPKFKLEWEKLIQTVIDSSLSTSLPHKLHPVLASCPTDKNPLFLETIIRSYDFDIDGFSRPSRNTIAMQAAQSNNINLLTILGKIGVSFDAQDAAGYTVAHYVKSVPAAKIVLDRNNNLINQVNNTNFSPLFVALMDRADKDLILYFIDKGANLFCASGSILHFLAFYLRRKKDINPVTFAKEIFEKVTVSGTNVRDLFTKTDRDNRTALEKSCCKDDFEIFKILLEKENELGITNLAEGEMLAQAIHFGAVETVSLILSQDKDSIHAVSEKALLELLNKKKTSYVSLDQEECYLLLNKALENSKKPATIENIPENLTATITQTVDPINNEHTDTGKEPIALESKTNIQSEFISDNIQEINEHKEEKTGESSAKIDNDISPQASKNKTSGIFLVRCFNYFVAQMEKFINKICNVFSKYFNIKNKDIHASGENTNKIGDSGDTPSAHLTKSSNNVHIG